MEQAQQKRPPGGTLGSSSTIRRVGLTAARVAGVVLASLLLLEVGVRLYDGQPLSAIRLAPITGDVLVQGRPTRSLAELAATLPHDRDVDTAWIDLEPDPGERPPVDPALAALAQRPRHPRVTGIELFRVWNRNFIQKHGCTRESLFRVLPMPIDVFESPDGLRRPRFRFHAQRTTPLGLTTNRFGFRGPEIELDKPAHTVRIAFVGASTTVGLHSLPFSYPRYVIHWLNIWARRSAPGVHFEGINGGREGIDSTDIAAVVRYEVLPLEPDLVVYYEGANQFICNGPPGGASPAPRPARFVGGAAWERIRKTTWEFSAAVRRLSVIVRILEMGSGREPEKPDGTLGWPEDLVEARPDIDRPDLPVSLPRILADLDCIRDDTRRAGAALGVSSFVWLAHEGLVLNPQRDGMIDLWLNEKCWPYRYADIRRLADLQNRVLARYAEDRQALFIDVAESFPSDPRLFLDAVHLDGDGTRVHAWIVLQEILPFVRARLASGDWPRADAMPLSEHPFLGPSRSIRVTCSGPADR